MREGGGGTHTHAHTLTRSHTPLLSRDERPRQRPRERDTRIAVWRCADARSCPIPLFFRAISSTQHGRVHGVRHAPARVRGGSHAYGVVGVADLTARRLQSPGRALAQEEGCAHARAAAAIAPGARQQQRFQAEAEHVPHQRGAVRPWALPPVSRGHRQRGNPTRGLRLCEAWTVHAAVALHGSLVHGRVTRGSHPVRLQTRRARACRGGVRGKR